MPLQSIREKNIELERIYARGQAILKDAPKGLSAEQALAFDEVKTAYGALKESIEREQTTDNAQNDLRAMETFMNAPVNRLAHAVNADDEGRKSLLGAGWEIKGGMLSAPTSQTGRTVTLADGRKTQMGTVPMYPEDVVFGPIPSDDPDAAAFYKRTRAILQPEYQPAYGRYLKLCVKTRSESMAWNMLSGTEQKALSEGTDSAGGFVVPPDVQAEMLVRTAQKSVMRAMCRVQATNRDTLRWPAVAPNASTYSGTSGASIYSSGFVGSWVGETPAFSDTDPSFQNFDIAIRKVRVATRLSNDFIADAAVNVLSWLAQNGGENLALTEDQGFINGLGAALQPLGLLNLGITQVNIAGTTSHTISNTTSSAGSATALMDLAYKLPAQYVSGARWLMARLTEGAIRKLVNGNGSFLWPPMTGSGFAGLNPTGYATELLGFPVMHSDWVPVDGTANNIVAVLGDFENYIIGQRTEITTVILRERFADVDQTGIILFERVGGGAFNLDAWRLGYVS